MSDSDDAFASADEGDQPTAAASNKKSESAKNSNPKGGGKPTVKKKSESDKTETKKKSQRPNSGDKTKPGGELSKSTKPKSPTKKGNQKGVNPKLPIEKKEKLVTQMSDTKPSKTAEVKSDSIENVTAENEEIKMDTATSDSKSENISDSDSNLSEKNTEVSMSQKKHAEVTPETKTSEADSAGNFSETDKSGAIAVSSPQSQNISRQEEKKSSAESAGEKPASEEKKKESGGSWSWGSWGSSLMSVASNSVTTFTSQVEEGFNTLVDAVENSLGALTPEELAEMQKMDGEEAPEEAEIERDETVKEKPEKADMNEPEEGARDEQGSKEEEDEGWFSSWGLSSGISSLSSVAQKTSNIVQSTSKNLVAGSLDVLETIGKKTFDVIKDHDPGLRKTKEVLFERGDKPNLSKVLREAKDEADMKAEVDREFEEARKAHFGSLFDDYQGLAHLEALEILSNQCEKKVQTLLGSMPVETLSAIKSDLVKIKQVFEWDENEEDDEELKEHEFAKLVTDNLSELHLGTTPNKLNTSQAKIRQKIADFYTREAAGEKTTPKEVHQMAIQALAELTSKSVEQFHKAGELVLLQKDSDKLWTDRAKCLESLTKVLCTEVAIVSSKFTQCLNKLGEDLEDSSVINPLVTNIYLEAGNSSTYIQDAFQLLLPCLQEATIQGSLDQAEN